MLDGAFVGQRPAGSSSSESEDDEPADEAPEPLVPGTSAEPGA